MALMRPCQLGLALSAGLVTCACAFGQGQTAGSITGFVRDDRGGTLPGVTVTVRGAGMAQLGVTDARGRFDFTGLVPGAYAVNAELLAFVLRSKTPIVVTGDSTACAILTMDIAPGAIREDGPFVIGPPPRLDVARVDAIVYLRILRSEDDILCGFTTHTAKVLEVLKHPGGLSFGETMTFWQDRVAEESRLCRPGGDYIVFLRSWERGLLKSAMSSPGAFVVRNGLVEPEFKTGWERYIGMKVEALLSELRRLVGGQ